MDEERTMTSSSSRVLEELKTIIEGNGNIPPKVSNRLILAGLIELYTQNAELREDILALRMRASVWGAVAGLLTSVGTALLLVASKLI